MSIVAPDLPGTLAFRRAVNVLLCAEAPRHSGVGTADGLVRGLLVGGRHHCSVEGSGGRGHFGGYSRKTL